MSSFSFFLSFFSPLPLKFLGRGGHDPKFGDFIRQFLFVFFSLLLWKSLGRGGHDPKIGNPILKCFFSFLSFFLPITGKVLRRGGHDPKVWELDSPISFFFLCLIAVKVFGPWGHDPKFGNPFAKRLLLFFFIEPNQVAQKGKPIDFDVIDRVPSGGTRLSTHRPSGFVF